MVLGKRTRKAPKRFSTDVKDETSKLSKKEDESTYSKEKLQKLKVPELRKKCYELKIYARGRKAELIQLILDATKIKEDSEETTLSPPRKRQKLTKTSTIELIDDSEEKEQEKKSTKAIERRRTSFIEEVGDDTMKSLSNKSKSKLLKRLSSIINLEEIGIVFLYKI